MGVPKFFRWLSERYPCLCEELKEYQIPEFDNLYLDMNGIIHVCSHPNDFDPHFRISEEKIFTDIFHYIEVLFRLIRPKKLFFMAVDGVAPRAKMNQQRGRRFSSAKEAETLEKKALEKGETLPKEKRFDSNCITPGTKFMAKLQEQLKYFVANKISNDKLWQKPTIILSGHSVPGEGEHKIMDYIRYLRSKPDWDPHTRHCLYGLDADLIILGMCTHEPNFSLLREEVKFVKQNKRVATPETTNYMLLHLSLLRDYLDLEFQSLKTGLPFPYDIERIIDDWVLLGFLVGNDFIPHLPHLHIHCNALTILYDAYRALLPTLDGYINESGVLNLPRFEKFLMKLSQFDTDTFNETYADMKYFESKTGRSLFPDIQVDEIDGKVKMCDEDLNSLINQSELEIFNFGDDRSDLDEAIESNGFETINNEDEQDKLFFKEFSQHKRDYYLNKMKYPSVSGEVLKKEAEGYVTALQWILFYYYRGCPSWSWYYPHHYSPYVSDLKGFSSLDIEFNSSKPFLPFQQLLAVLPSASKEFLPECYQSLMTSDDSPIIDYYPKDFQCDLNGKRQEWEAVVLIPFIEEKRLLDAMEPYCNHLTKEEQYRNSHGPMHVYSYSSQSLGKYSAPKYFPDLSSNHAKCEEVYPWEISVPLHNLVTGRHPALSASKSLYVSGFPVLSSLKITGNLEKKGVKVFEQPSRSENMILRIVDRPELSVPLESIAEDFLSRDHVYVSYPHLTPARVTMLVSGDQTAGRVSGWRDKDSVKIMQNKTSETSAWSSKLKMLIDHHLTKFGIDLCNCCVIVYANPLEGTKLSFTSSGKAIKEMIWSQAVVGYPLDTCLTQVDSIEKRSSVQQLHLKDVFPPGRKAFMIGPIDYGYELEVKEVNSENSKLSVDLLKTTEPDLTAVVKALESLSVQYYPGYHCAERLGISSHLFSRITSGIIVQSPHTDSDKTNIGLSLKFSRTNQQMIGFTRKEGNQWLYSDRAINLVNEYMFKFPDLFDYLAANTSDDIFFKDQMFPNDKSAERLTEIRAWLKTLEKGEIRSVDSELLEPSVVKVLEETLACYTEEDFCMKTMRLPPHYLYLPKPELMIASPDPEAEHCILDRIVFVRECHSIPLGSKGIIIGIEKKASKGLTCEGSGWEEAATLYDIVFDKEVVGGQAIFGTSKKLVYRLNKQVFINISHGERKHSGRAPLVRPLFSENRRTSNFNRSNNSTKFERAVNFKMPSFNQQGSGNWRQPPNRNQAVNTSGNFMNGQTSPTKTSGSVKEFFNAYRNNSTGVNTEAGRSGHNQPTGRVGPTQNQLDAVDPLTDMWNLLKNLQVHSSESPEQETTKSEEPANSNAIRSQTFTRSQSSQQPDTGNPFIFNRSPSSQQLDSGNQQSRDNTLPKGMVRIPVPPPNLFQNHKSSAPGNSKQFVEQTEALKKILCLDGKTNLENNNAQSVNQVGDQFKSADLVRTAGTIGDRSFNSSRPCGHLPSCLTYFYSLCSLYNLEKPSHYLFNTRGEGFKTACKFSDGFKFVGPATQTVEQSREVMACVGIEHLSSRYGQPPESNQLSTTDWRADTGQTGSFPPPPPAHLLKTNPNELANQGQSGSVAPDHGTPLNLNLAPQHRKPRRGRNKPSGDPQLSQDAQSTVPQQSTQKVNDQYYSPPPPQHKSPKQENKQNKIEDGVKVDSRNHRWRRMKIAANFQNPPIP